MWLEGAQLRQRLLPLRRASRLHGECGQCVELDEQTADRELHEAGERIASWAGRQHAQRTVHAGGQCQSVYPSAVVALGRKQLAIAQQRAASRTLDGGERLMEAGGQVRERWRDGRGGLRARD